MLNSKRVRQVYIEDREGVKSVRERKGRRENGEGSKRAKQEYGE